MILDTTVQTPEVKRKMVEMIGEPYRLIERIRLGGVGSKRMRIIETSEHFIPFLSKQQDTVYCNIEKRKKGIAIHFKKYQTVYSWLIPKGCEGFKNDEVFIITGDGPSLGIKKDRNFEENKTFLRSYFGQTLE